MDTLGGWSDTGFGVAKAYDPESDKTFLENMRDVAADPLAHHPGLNMAKGLMLQAPALGKVYDAAERQKQLVAIDYQAKNVEEDAYGGLIAKVKDATGVLLDNPLHLSTYDQRALADDQRRKELMGFTSSAFADAEAKRRAEFTARLTSLKQQFPDALAAIDPATPIRDIARKNTFEAEKEAATPFAERGVNPVAGFAASVAGGIAGSRGDPGFWLSFLAPMGGAGETVVARILNAGLTQGGANMAITGMGQNAVQEWRREAGLPAGQAEGWHETLMAGLVGLGLGAGLKGASEAIKGAAVRLSAGKATSADYAELAKAGFHVPDDLQAALRAAGEIDRVNGDMLKAADGVPAHAAPVQLAEKMAQMENPSAPLPLTDRPIPKFTSDDLARKIVDEASSMGAAVDSLRADTKAVLSALSSPDPHVRDLGRLASLGDEALALVKAGDVEPVHGALVGATTGDPTKQAVLMAALKEARPESVAQARAVLTDHITAGNAPEAAMAFMGERPPILQVHRVSTTAGNSVHVQPLVIEASSLKASSDAGYDAALQPRNRDRAASQAQIRDIAGNLDPERLGLSSEADRGAPIIGPDGMVESGNGRVMALRKVYEAGGDAAQNYKDWLTAQGVDTSGFKEPVLVRQRLSELTPEQRQAFTVEANQSATLAMSAGERALADARQLRPDILDLIRNADDLGAAANRDFMRAFVQSLPQSEQGMMMSQGGALSSEGLMRIRNAVLAKAYGGDGVLLRIAEATHDDVKSISNALVAAAPEWSKFRSAVETGMVRADMDLTQQLLEAVSRTADLRAKGVKLDVHLSQLDAFEQLALPVESWMRMFYDGAGRRAAGGVAIAERLKTYAIEARKVSADDGLGFLPPVRPEDVQLIAGKKAADDLAIANQSDLFNASRAGDGTGGADLGATSGRRGAGESGAATGSGGEAGASQGLGATSAAQIDTLQPAPNLLDHVPIKHENGKVEFVSRETLARIGQDDLRLADVVRACK